MTNKDTHYLIAAVPYSDNYGDALIHHSLAWKLGNYDISSDALDIAGRHDFARSASQNAIKDKILKSRFEWVRQVFIPLNGMLVALKNYRVWMAKIKAADVVLIGGGNLISDVYLNFPLKLYFLSLFCYFSNTDYAVVYVGVAKRMSGLGRWLFKKLFSAKKCRYISVRDAASKANIEQLLGAELASKVVVSIDPAVNLNLTYSDLASSELSSTPYAAINIVNPTVLMVNSDHDVNFSEQSYLQWLKTTVDKVKAAGLVPVLYTNGAQEDEQYMSHIATQLADAKVVNTEKVEDLVSVVSQAQCVFATRLHSAISAFSFSVPFTVMSWDSKVSSFVAAAKLPTSMLFDFSTEGMKQHAEQIQLADMSELKEQVVQARHQVVSAWDVEFRDMLQRLDKYQAESQLS
ncbi:hypothetical protein AHAT_01960 [Agarivorans sp. Toyoura001]|uniref:polysaccharide pyruvyl transferase family protein n=1 Tax=Agarivorans sp. Toyoura001 TaxID=2283141 RepID=UPI0010D28A8C|nr:polysaccharide pyruvyl transferase family protein [Agarivorans sp. Toyoura001]GDY24306.1 hypothetical protein AHAT_01960 [Agarivorans sp. Toyoura001]